MVRTSFSCNHAFAVQCVPAQARKLRTVVFTIQRGDGLGETVTVAVFFAALVASTAVTV